MSSIFESISPVLQVIIAVSIWIVWVFRFDNIEAEFKHFGYSNRFRNLIGATKISLAALLVAGIWFPALIPFSALSMALLMVGAQVTHLRVRNPFSKFVPSLVLLSLSIGVFYLQSGRA
jgi:hypothetical protein